MSIIKVGVIGCGAIGREHIKRLCNKIAGVTVVAVCDVSAEGALEAARIAPKGCKVYTDTAAIVGDSEVDAVVITSPGFAHKETLLAAIRAGKAVFCEKPLCTTAADCKAVVDAEIAAGRHLVQVGFMRRYDRGYRQIKELLDSGDFGQPLVIKCTHRASRVDDSYTTEMAVTDTAIHEIDCIPWLIGDDEWDKVQVVMGAKTKHAHQALQDPQMMIMQTKKGVTVVLEVYVNCNFGYDINCEVVCEDGVINLPCPSFPTIRKENRISTAIEQNWMLRFIDSYEVELQDWVDNVKAGTVSGPTAWDGYAAALTADALVKAQKTGAVEAVVTGGTPAFYQ